MLLGIAAGGPTVTDKCFTDKNGAAADGDAEIVRFDHSSSAERPSSGRLRCMGEHAALTHFVPAALTEPPFAEATSDCIHSTGVLHHTASTHPAEDRPARSPI